MDKMKKFIFAGLFAVGCFVGGNTHAATFVDNTDGVPERTSQEAGYELVTSKLFDNFSISTSWGTITGHGSDSFVYEGGGDSSTSGKINIAGYEDVLLYYNMSNYNSGTYTMRLFVQSGAEDFWADLKADTVITGTATGTINISETGAKSFRAGLNVNAIGTETFTLTVDKRRKK